MKIGLQSRQWTCLRPLSGRGWLFFLNTRPCLKPMERQCPCARHFSLSTGTWPKTILMLIRNSACTGLNNTAGARDPMAMQIPFHAQREQVSMECKMPGSLRLAGGRFVCTGGLNIPPIGIHTQIHATQSGKPCII